VERGKVNKHEKGIWEPFLDNMVIDSLSITDVGQK
jgi:hypothetical protein